eukprot:TRINITY_DN20331_c0_g1_i2.p1 TRINITY_DN20331_c0_g1~~TRINITY_DN20331_c0_g1_i2.p1  ORF type:complete len:349 (-),score=59.25 TRINITY_DN20331_c0_g1_i2:88-1134(-)
MLIDPSGPVLPAVTWFILCAGYNVVIKVVFLSLPIPIFSTVLQSIASFVVSALILRLKMKKGSEGIAKTAWMLLERRPRELGAISAAHFMGFWMTSISVNAGSVAFTHIIKACEPVFTVLVSRVAFSAVYSWATYLSIIPIVFGASLCSIKPGAQVVADGCGAALCSNFAMACYFLNSKQMLSDKKLNQELPVPDDLKAIATLAVVSLSSTAWGVAFLISQPLFTSNSELSLCWGHLTHYLTWLLLLSSVLHGSYNACSYVLLSKVAAMTHSVLGCVRRVVVIGTGVVLFGSSLSSVQYLGAFIACAGVVWYNYLKVSEAEARENKDTKVVVEEEDLSPTSMKLKGVL